MAGTILLTGAAGFIGSHFAERLISRGHDVIGLDLFDAFYDPAIKEANVRRIRDLGGSFTLIRGDIRDGELLRELPDSIDSIVHLAARAGVRPSIADPLLYTDVNVRGTQELLHLADQRGIRRFVFASSSSVYGNNEKVPFSEDDRVDHPISPYAATKKAGELICHAASHLQGMDCICLRFFTVYGPRQRPDLAIRKFARKVLTGEPIPRFGDGSTARDYTFINDIVDGIESALAWTSRVGSSGGAGRFEVVNLGESRTITLNRMIQVVGEVFDRIPHVEEHPEQPGDVARTFADVSRARDLLDYAPNTEFEDGMRIFAEWYLREGARQDGVV